MIFCWQTAPRYGLMGRWPFYRRLPMSKSDNGDNRGPTAGTFGVAPNNPLSPAPSGIHPPPLSNPVPAPQPAPMPKPVAMPAPLPAPKMPAVKKKAAKKRPAKKTKKTKKRGKKKPMKKTKRKAKRGRKKSRR
jgi:hypothetical protein